MPYALDGRTIALYDLDSSGASLAGDPSWDLTAVSGGGWQAAATMAMVELLQGASWAVERELLLTASQPGTVLEIGGWGESESVNIQLVVGWDEQLRPYVGWERDGGIDWRLRADVSLPLGVPIRLAVTRNNGTVCIYANGSLLVRADGMPLPTGGTYPGGVTPGMTLAIGRRVSTSDPQVYAGGGWLRISSSRTSDEIIADWEATYPAPHRPLPEDYDEADHAAVAADYWVLRGTMGSGDEQVAFAWSTVAVAREGEVVEPRLVESPGSVAMGIPTAVGEPPERVSLQVRVANHDRALDPYLVGGPTPQTEYTGPSVYNIEARLYHGYVLADGTTQERPWTPTLVLDGSVEHRDGVISLSLASRDVRILGRSRRMVTVGQIRDAPLVPGTGWGDVYWGPIPPDGDGGYIEQIRLVTDALDQIVPWAYGRPLIAPIEVSASGSAFRHYICCLTTAEPWDDMRIWVERDGVIEEVTGRTWIESWGGQIELQDEAGEAFRAWVLGLWYQVSEERDWSRIWVAPRSRLLGLPWDSDELLTSADIIRRLVEEHSEAGAAGVCDICFSRLSAQLAYTSGVVGGLYGDASTLAEVISHIAGPAGIGLWIGPDDRLHGMLPGAWTSEDAAAAAQELPVLTDADALPAGGGGGSTWTEIAQADAEDVGAPATWVTISWDADQRRVFASAVDRLSAARRVDVRTEIEVRLSGAWIFPPEATAILRGAGGARAFADRVIQVVTPLWVARLGPGALLRLRHSHGLGYDGSQIVRLLRAEVMPGERAAACTLLDVTALSMLRAGVLDSEEHWPRYIPQAGEKVTFAAETDAVELSVPVATSAWEGCSLWISDATDDRLIGSWRIDKVLAANLVRLDRAAPASGSSTAITRTPGMRLHRLPWVVMRTNTTDPVAEYRADKIRVCEEEKQIFRDGTPGFQYWA